MNTTIRNTAVGVFQDLTHAEHAVEELRASGFGADQIGFVVPDAAAEDVEPPPADPGTKTGEVAAVGVGVGVALGAILGAVLSNVILPGIGPVVVGGLLAATLGGAAVGAASGGVVGALVGMSVPEEEARHYEREFHSGCTLLTVRADDRYEEAVAVLRRAEQWEPERPTHGSRLSGLAEESGPADGTGSVVPGL
ncbi:MAG TPA: hypothetical protein DDY78_14145 [Planctomycetales bacterium]|nr:hypothetical protein [Planctomycetales bacterium]